MSIVDYINLQEEIKRPHLYKVYELLKEILPMATEKISWRMPTFWYRENIIHFAAAKEHLGIYPGSLEYCPFKEELSKFDTSKGAIRMPYDKIDYELIRRIVIWRLECVANIKQHS